MEKKLMVGKEATYQEMCDLLDKAEDIPHSSKLELKGWTVGDNHDGILGETIPLGVYYVSVKALYNEKSENSGSGEDSGDAGENENGSGESGSGEDSGDIGENGNGSGGTGEDLGDNGNSGSSGGNGNDSGESGSGEGSGDTGENGNGSGGTGEDSGDNGNSGSSGGNGNDSGESGSGEDSGDNGNSGGSGGNGSGITGGFNNMSSFTDSDSTGTASTITKPKEIREETAQEILPEIPTLIQGTQDLEFPVLSTEEDSEEAEEVLKLEESAIVKMVEEAERAEEGTILVIEMKTEEGKTATEIPIAVLETVKGKDIDIVLDMGDYRWTINGKDIQAEELEAINLQVIIDSDAIDTSVVEKFADGEPARQITLVHNGEFAFKATLTINVGSQYEGETGNLYYYNNHGELEFIDAGQIDADGNVDLDFSHASDYVVVVGRDRTEEETGKTEESMPAEIISAEVVPVEEEIEGTGNVLTLLVIIFFVAMAVAAGVILVKKSRK